MAQRAQKVKRVAQSLQDWSWWMSSVWVVAAFFIDGESRRTRRSNALFSTKEKRLSHSARWNVSERAGDMNEKEDRRGRCWDSQKCSNSRSHCSRSCNARSSFSLRFLGEAIVKESQCQSCHCHHKRETKMPSKEPDEGVRVGIRITIPSTERAGRIRSRQRLAICSRGRKVDQVRNRSPRL
ncbi:hypothetical protein Poli38472_009816 [Pythium oligandrum]|uniref:Uncharacterized protein n=1 Tax=Pythium oligandrum TaxID=41045 RepID=A0A8K1FL46_PYTOL|nr:hypothetical protein Poli38472_009816 [Pythium oligandrum]|eukprot:TMW62323.1 hypothetical protein Poli38472_009816 [Pythium oligandrum]